ncbi:MAG: filamentous hemagglutinin N-terminal domain-containing protein [Selenomonas sp.]|nr:filamentous hemagglutinin N-terminal domain-containing protein [Selenomonas sp.]
MNALTKKDKLALQVSLTLVAGMFSLVPVAQGAPVLEKVISGGADVTPGTHTTITSVNENNIINWRDFSIAQNESVTFDNGNKTNNYLNVVTGNGTSYVDGVMQGGKDVYLVNPNGVIMGEHAQIDVGSLYVSTRDLSDYLDDVSKGNESWNGTPSEVLSPSDVKSEVVNMGNIQATSVYVEGTNIRFLDTADVKNSDGSDLLTNVTLVTKNNAGYVHVGYELANNNPDESGKLNLSGPGRPATTLGYKINGKTYKTAINDYTGKNSYDFARIENVGQLTGMESNKAINYMLTEDIPDASSLTAPIGTEGDPFTGNFDGNYHTISGLNITADYAGLFGYVKGENGQNSIRNVGIIDPKITANVYGGALAGVTYNTKIENVYVKNTSNEKMDSAHVKSAIENSPLLRDRNDSSIFGRGKHSTATAVGGIIGKAGGKSFINSVYNDNTVINGAGIVGELADNSILTNAYNNGLIWNNADYTWTQDDLNNIVDGYISADYVEHYGIVDKVTSGTVSNVYNSGAYIRRTANSWSAEASRELAPITITNGYVITKYDVSDFDTENFLLTLDKSTELASPTLSNGGSATSASSYAFFPSGKSKDDDGIWRIYEGHSFPLLRSFLKANGKGTVPVGYNLALYANATKNETTNAYEVDDDAAPTMKLKGSSADGKITYNGYYIGGADVAMDESRGLKSEKVKSNTTSLIKDVGDTNIFFYSFDQDGYDLATEALTVAARPLANPAGIKNVDKVYDGTTTADTALAKQFGATVNLLDNQIGTVDNIPLVEDPGYGIVKVYNADGNLAHTDDVAINKGFITSANYTNKDGDLSEDANIQSVDNTGHPNGYVIKVTADKDIAEKDILTNTQATAGNNYDADRANDHNNYTLTAADVEGIKITGDITLRPVKVGLHTGNYDDNNATIIEKVYDKSDQVVLGSNSDVYAGWTPNEGDTVTAKDNVYLANGDTDTGLVYKTVENQDDKVRLVVSTPYYSNSNGVVSDAGTDYKTNYQFVLSGDNASNYQVQGLDGNKLDLITNNDKSYYLLNGKGAINKRSIKADSISFANKDDVLVERTADPNQSSVGDVHGTKVYDNSTNFFYKAGDPNTSEYAAKVLFDTTNTITPDAALNNTQEDGFIWDPNDPNDAALLDKLKNALTLTGAEFSGANVDGVTIEENTVDNTITYSVMADPNSDIWKNYTLDGKNVTGKAVPIVREGNITHRIITVGMRDGIGSIDKNYDTTADVVDNNNVGYVKFHVPNATGGQDDGGYVTYAGSTKLVGNDGVVWDISGAYQEVPAAQTHNNMKVDAADVYLDADGNPAAKGIIYSVGLTGTKAPNYIIKNVAETDDEALARVKAGTDKASLNATGVIDQLELTPVFASITKQYDGTAYVLPQTVTMSDGSEKELVPKKIEDATTNPVTYKSAEDQINITLPGLLDEGKVKVDTTSPDFSAVYNSANVSEANKVYYSGLKLASTDGSSKINNYKIANTGTGTGNITKLKLDEANLTPKYNDIKKTYDNDTVLDNAASFVKDIAISGVAGTGAKLTVLDGTTAAYTDKNRHGQDDNHAVNFTFKVKDESGNYYFGDNPSTNEFSFSQGTTGKLLARDVLVTVNDNLTKTYDAMEEYTDGNRNLRSGDNVLTLDGLLGKDENVSTAKYNDANASTTSGDKTVTYKPLLSAGDPTNYKLVNAAGNTIDGEGNIYDADNNVIGTLTGSGTINKRPLTLTFADLSKKYDGTANLTDDNVAAIDVTLDDGLSGSVISADGTNVNKENLDKDYSYGVLDNTGFSSNANAGTANAVQYNGIDADVLGDKIGNYSLYYKYGDNDATAVVNGTGYGLGSIGKKKLAYTDFAATFNDVTKVYDATNAVKADGGVNTLVNSFTINGETVDYATSGNSGYSIASANYGTMDNSGTFTPNVNAGTQSAGTQNAVFKFTIGSDWEDNYDFSDLANSPYFDSDTRTVAINTAADNGNATITAKTIFAALLDSDHYVSPNKVYDGNKTVKTAAGQPVGSDLISSGTSAKFGDYLTISGLEGNDANMVKVSAAYNDENVANTVENLGNAVNYTVDMGTVAGNYNLQGVDEDNKLQGAGVITPKKISLVATIAQKVYDATSAVKLTGGTADPTFTIDTGVNGETISVDNSIDSPNAIVGNYGTYTGNTFTPDGNVALDNGNVTNKAVQYTNVANALKAGENTLLTNYTLASGNGGIYSTDNGGTVTFGANQAKGKITKLGISSISADIGEVEKVYDGTGSLTYVHNEANGYDEGQRKTVGEITSVTGIKLGDSGVSLSGGKGYTIDEAGYTNVNASEVAGDRDVKYKFTIDKSVFNNLEITSNLNDGTWNDGNYTFETTKNGNTITTKNVYATLTDLATSSAPTKVYNGLEDVVNNTQANPTGTAKDVSGYMTVTGLVNDASIGVQDTYSIAAEYENKDVAGKNGSVVDYKATITNPDNYKLYTKNAAGQVVDADGNATTAVNNVLKGYGTITPKELKFQAGYTQKTYDNETSTIAKNVSDNKYNENEAIYNADNPKYQFVGLVNGETLTPDADKITGDYVVAGSGEGFVNGYKKDSHVEATLNPDGSVASVDYKAVQYTGLQDAFDNAAGTAKQSNYVLNGAVTAGGSDAEYYGTGSGTAVYSKDLENGKIFRKVLNDGDITTEWKAGASKAYDTTSEVKDYDKWFSIHTIAAQTDGVEYELGYNLGDYGAQYTKADNVNQTVKDADTGYNLRYQVDGLSGETLIDFDLSNLTDNEFNRYFDSKDNTVNGVAAPVYGDITKYKIRGSAEDENIKTYDGNRKADASYFNFNPDDEAFVQSDLGKSLKDLVDVTAKYYGEHGEDEDSAKNATISPDGNAQNKRQVVYSLGSLAGNDELKNYELDKDTYNGTGDIRQRKVYVVDKGGEVITKTYDGSEDWPDDIEATAAGSRFKLADPNDDAKTGVIEAEKDDVTLNKDNITGKYVSKDVIRENGEVVNTGVQYEGFALTGVDNNNYYLTVDKNNPTGSLPNTSKVQGSVTYEHGADGIVITEKKGGKITPKAITVNVINSPEKEYNRDIDVNGSKDGIKYASVKNLEVKIGDDVKEGGALSDTVRTISTGINNDKVTIALNGAEYKDKNVSYNDLGQVQSNKVSYFDLSWDNGNYKLVGESEDITGASGDTMTQGYDADNATFTGRLTDYTGTINPRLIDVTKVDKVVKTYDGDAAVESNPTFNITDADTSNPHFYIADDDKALLVDDKLDSYLAISGNYENKNANIYPKEYSEEAAEGGKKVNYNLVWNGGDEDARKNYKFADAGEYDITGTGDILRRAVNVTDLGGDVLARDYRGTKDTSLPETNLTKRFKEERNVSGTGSTGIIDADVKLNKDAIKGAYAPNGDVARDAAGNVINKAVTFSGFELQGTVDGTTGFNSKDNYYLTAQDGTVKLNGGVVSDVAHTIGKNGELLTITEKEGGKIDPKKIYISVEKSPTKVYDGDNLVKNDEKTGTAYASASNLKAAADGADVQRSFGNVNNVVSFTLDPGSGESESFDVTLEKATYDNTSTDPEKDNSMDVSRGANREVLKDKITSYNLSWTNGNYDLKSEPASAEAGKQADTFAADGTNGYTDGSGKRTGVLKDYGGEITPKTISVTSMDTSKTYSGKEGYVVANPQVNAEIEGIIAKDMPGNGNVQDFLGLTVGKATYGAPTQAAIDEAQAENAPKNKKATADEIAEAEPWDAAFNRTADPFQHQVAYSGIAITNGNYELDKDEFDGTGTINRAVVTAHPKSATIKAGEAMPSFKGTLDGFMDGETMPKTFYTTVENEDGTTTTTSETRQVPLSEYYNDPEFIYWGPEDGVTNRTEGKNNVYGWYLRKEVGEDKDGNEVVSYYKEKEANLDKNYTLVQAEEPSTLVVEPAPRSGGGGGSGSIVSPPVRESTPVYTTPSVPTPAAPQPQPVLEVGYVEKPVVADSSVYQNVSKDTSNSTNHEAQAAIQYGRKGAGIAAGNDDSGKSSTIAIELAEVVNLLGGDVASDGSMSLTNTDSGRKLSVGSTEEGYLSVGAERKEGSIGIETEGENILEEMAAKEGSIGIESEEAQAEVRTEDKEGQIELETEEEMLDAEGKKSSISLRSDGRDGESEITYSDGDLSILNSLNEDKKKEQKGEEDEEDSEKSDSREGEAAIAYNDVA